MSKKWKPWYNVVTPREDLREGKPQDAAEFAVHLDDGAGNDPGLWELAQALALYPPGTQEKRWVDGVLARKKGLGL